MTELLIVGSGLAGLFAAALARRREAHVRVIAEGRGGLSLSHGCIDAPGEQDTVRFAGRPGRSPLDVSAVVLHLQPALTELSEILTTQHLEYRVSLDRPLRLPTAVGSVHTTAAAPLSLSDGDLEDSRPMVIADIRGVRDFSAAICVSGLKRHGVAVASGVTLALPPQVEGSAHNPLQLARTFDSPETRRAIFESWAAQLPATERLGVPAVLGFEDAQQVLVEAADRLGLQIFEIPTLPPSLPGLRLERALRRFLVAKGVEFIEGPSVRGEIDGRSGGRRVSGVLATTAGGPRLFRGRSVLLATGGALHGGWLGFPSGEVQESVFGLPIQAAPDREGWTAASPFEPQLYSTFGLQVDGRGRPCNRAGEPYFENLYAAGGILGGIDRTIEGSRQGIDLASAHQAVEAALA